MKTPLQKAPTGSQGNPAYPKLNEREAMVEAAAKEDTPTKKIPADDLKKLNPSASPKTSATNDQKEADASSV